MSDLEKWVIKSFNIIGDYTIELHFADGKKQTINFEPVIGKGWMTSLKDQAYFKKVKLNDGGNLEWPEGQDFNPEALYDWPRFEQAYIDDLNSM
ncbi:DUF2442 domain-containing protein [Microbulbifer sp. SSSA005]|uniref:DUF2442 domain-containing protein n=1 Tax=unclassified Microbulbifer TaxID=2619833 RepID=UPI00403AFF29